MKLHSFRSVNLSNLVLLAKTSVLRQVSSILTKKDVKLTSTQNLTRSAVSKTVFKLTPNQKVFSSALGLFILDLP